METFAVKTSHRAQFLDITGDVQACVRKSGIEHGLCVVFIPHTTAGVTINENADPDVRSDIISHLAKLVPQNSGFDHCEGNSDAHIKASTMGFSQSVIVDGGRLVLGTWQSLYFCEFDGPRSRRVHVRVLQA